VIFYHKAVLRSNQAGLSWTPQAVDRMDYTIFIWEKKGWN